MSERRGTRIRALPPVDREFVYPGFPEPRQCVFTVLWFFPAVLIWSGRNGQARTPTFTSYARLPDLLRGPHATVAYLEYALTPPA